jgi:molybdopterin synthase sulfur carrier subunit
MGLDILYFGRLRDALGRERERADPPSHVLTAGDLVAWLSERGEPYASALAAAAPLGAAAEGEAIGLDGNLFGAREVALFPPPGAF